MSNRLAALLAHDVTLNWRYAIFGATAFVILATALVVHLLADLMPPWFLAMVIYTDNSAVGFFFLGGIILLERAENVRDTLAVTPLSATEYLTSKTLIFTTLALVGVSVLALVAGSQVNWPLFLGSVGIASVFYIGLGAFVAVRVKTVTGYIMSAVIWFLPVILPAGLAFLEPMPLWAAMLPTAAQFDLIITALEGAPISAPRFAILFLSALAGAVIAWRVGIIALRRDLGEKS